MDLYGGLFGLFLLTLSVILAYRWGIKPDREAKKQRSRRATSEMRRQHWERTRRPPIG